MANQNRIRREKRTVEAMIRIWCRGHLHDNTAEKGLCPSCTRLLGYAHTRLEHCRFGSEKPTCAKCPVHCYRRGMRENIQAVMRYAGPRMLIRHPVLTLSHLSDGWKS